MFNTFQVLDTMIIIIIKYDTYYMMQYYYTIIKYSQVSRGQHIEPRSPRSPLDLAAHFMDCDLHISRVV